jgi:serine/threonine protein kinase
MAEDLHDNQKNVLEEAVEQFVDAQLQGKEPVIDEFVKKYPDFEHQVRKRIRKLRKIDTLFSSLIKPDASDFEDTAADQNLVGEKVGSFEIAEIIGRGGMGVVYLARDTKLKRSVAVKSIPAKLAGDSNSRTRFRREAEILASLNHPNIAVIHDIIEQDESAGYLVLEYVPGETLAERIARKPLNLEEALSIARQIAEAVSAAHKKGIIHRDLKPNNIKITPDGRVKVLDFGLAKPSPSEDKKIDITATEPGRVIGTPAYMSPEQARGKSTDHRTDIWSFGCIMYQMLTGLLPFEGETATDTLAKIIECQPNWETLPQETPTNIHVLLQNCLEKNPDKRLKDIKEAVIVIRETLSRPLVAPAFKSRRIAMIIGAVAIGIILSVSALKLIPKKEIQISVKQIRLVVLPFENLGPDDDEYFAAGITDAVTARLAGIHGLGVISRQGAVQYKNKEKSASLIAKDLHVDYILEGTIQRERPSDPNSRVKITLQLIKASNYMHIWAKEYNGDMREIFSLQSDVAEQVARELDITLLEPERQALAYKATENMEAYDYYLKGKEAYRRSFLSVDVNQALKMYEKAVYLDPEFAPAWAQLSRVHSRIYYQRERSDSRLQKAKEAVQNAIRLDPELPETLQAMAVFSYYCHRDLKRALEYDERALKRQPGNSELIYAIGTVQRRLGRFDEALANLKDASELDPLHFTLHYQLGYTLTAMRKYAEAESAYERANELAPDQPMPYIWRARNQVLWKGKNGITEAREVLKEALQKIETVDRFSIVNWLANINVYDRRYEEALDLLSSVPDDYGGLIGAIPNELKRALIYEYMSKEELAKKQYEMAKKHLEMAKIHYEMARSKLESKKLIKPKDARAHGPLGIAYAGLGRKQDAIREGELALELDPKGKAGFHSVWLRESARIYVMVGKYDKAIEKLKLLVPERTTQMSSSMLQVDPAWDPLRNHPDFKKLIEIGK